MAEPTSLDLASFIDTTMPLVYLENSILRDSEAIYTDDIYITDSNGKISTEQYSFEANKFGVKTPTVPRISYDRNTLNDKTLTLENNLVLGASINKINIMTNFQNLHVCSLLVLHTELLENLQTGNFTFHSLNKELNRKRAILKTMPVSEFLTSTSSTETLVGAGTYRLAKNKISFNLSVFHDTMAVFNFTCMTYKTPKVFHKSYAQYGPLIGEVLQKVGGTYIHKFFTDRSNSIWAGGYYPEVSTDPNNTVSNSILYRKGVTKNYQPSSGLSQNSVPTNERLYENTITNYSKFIDQSSVYRSKQIRGVAGLGDLVLYNDEIMSDSSDSDLDFGIEPK